MRYLICYDIPDDKTRDNIVNYLERFAWRVQYSVFSCRLETETGGIGLEGFVGNRRRLGGQFRLDGAALQGVRKKFAAFRQAAGRGARLSRRVR